MGAASDMVIGADGHWGQMAKFWKYCAFHDYTLEGSADGCNFVSKPADSPGDTAIININSHRVIVDRQSDIDRNQSPVK